jgi:tryptophan synthase alpha chain
MGYLNPAEAMGYQRFAETAAEVGVDGVLIVDMTVEESDELLPVLREQALDPIFLLAPTTSDARIRATCEKAAGYLYYVSLKGVTGSQILDAERIGPELERIRRHTQLPLAVGFGIRDADSAARVARVADGVVVGSALVACIAEHGSDGQVLAHELDDIMRAMRTAMDEESQAPAAVAPEGGKA